MKTIAAAAVLALCIALCASGEDMVWEKPAQGTRFTALDINVDGGSAALAAYQIELTVKSGDAKVVGVEGGEHAAFTEAPYYDPAALTQDRIIIAAFNTGADLPSGKTRVARVHMQVTGAEPEYAITLQAAASSDGKPIAASVSIAQGEKE